MHVDLPEDMPLLKEYSTAECVFTIQCNITGKTVCYTSLNQGAYPILTSSMCAWATPCKSSVAACHNIQDISDYCIEASGMPQDSPPRHNPADLLNDACLPVKQCCWSFHQQQ